MNLISYSSHLKYILFCLLAMKTSKYKIVWCKKEIATWLLRFTKHFTGVSCKFNKSFSLWNQSPDHMTAWKVSKYGVISGPYFSAFGLNMEIYYCVKSVQIRSYFWSVFSSESPYSVRIQQNTDQKKLGIWTTEILPSNIHIPSCKSLWYCSFKELSQKQ